MLSSMLFISQKGYIESSPAFTDNEFNFIKKSINDQYKDILSKTSINREILEKHFNQQFSVSDYHLISKYIEHSKI